MKAYILVFISILFLIISTFTYMGMASTLNVLDHGDLDKENKIINSIREDISKLYKENKNLEEQLLNVSEKVDSLYAGLNRKEILKDFIFNRAVLGLVITAVISLIAGFLLWFGNLKLIVDPVNKTVKELKETSKNDWEGKISLHGAKEIKYLQNTLNSLIVDLKHYRDRVKQVERENLGSFITHKIKNSLTPINLCAYNIKDIVKNNDEARENIDLIISEISKTEQFISQLKGFLKTPEIKKEKIELNAFILGLVNKYKEVIFNRLDETCVIVGDPLLLEEVLINLIQNALDASINEDDKVYISIKSGVNPIITVKDSGCGIEDEKLKMVFDEYFTTKQKGMGIGLSYVKKIIDMHGFDINIESEINNGTEIRIICNG